MGRNANGLLKSNTDKGDLTVGQLGLHPKAIKMFENPISSWLWEYNDKDCKDGKEHCRHGTEIQAQQRRNIARLQLQGRYCFFNRWQGRTGGI